MIFMSWIFSRIVEAENNAKCSHIIPSKCCSSASCYNSYSCRVATVATSRHIVCRTMSAILNASMCPKVCCTVSTYTDTVRIQFQWAYCMHVVFRMLLPPKYTIFSMPTGNCLPWLSVLRWLSFSFPLFIQYVRCVYTHVYLCICLFVCESVQNIS